MRFKREIEFSIDEDGSLWMYLPNYAINLSFKDLAGAVDKWRAEQYKIEKDKEQILKDIKNYD